VVTAVMKMPALWAVATALAVAMNLIVEPKITNLANLNVSQPLGFVMGMSNVPMARMKAPANVTEPLLRRATAMSLLAKTAIVS
jgi:hypothetical protein